MRPLLRPARPGAYPDFSLASIAQLRLDLAAVTLAQPSAQVRTGLGIPHGPVSLRDVTRGLRHVALNPPPKRKRNAPAPVLTAVQKARKLLMDQVVNQYSQANPFLRAGLGRYCSYCEQTLSEFIATEHVVAKAPWPMTAVSWDNFLLSCRACNSYKWDHPGRTEVAAWGLLPPPADDLASYTAIRDHYLWPDNDIDAYRGLLPALFFRTATGAWKAVSRALSVGDGVVCVDPGTDPAKVVLADIPTPGGVRRLEVRVQLVPGGANATEAGRTLDLNQMNHDGVDKGDDSRMWDRTQRWLEAVETFTGLSQNWSPQLWAAACRNARTGFLSTWIRVLELRGGSATPFPIVPAQTMTQAFLSAMTQQVVLPHGPYPGTDLAYIP